MEPTNENAEKKVYLKPTITALGDIEAITLAFSTGNHLDGDYRYGTPVPGDILS
jgi:hypothetical protein